MKKAKILRFLEEQSFQRVGGNRVLKVNVRIIAATNTDLEQAIEQGQFREDLYYRLNVIPIRVPALRERLEDIPLLVETFLEECSKKSRVPKKSISLEALERLSQHSWPGNVRELKNLVERLTIMVEGATIEIGDLPEPYSRQAISSDRSLESILFSFNDMERAKRVFEREFLRHKLASHANDLKKTSAALNIRSSEINDILKNTP